MTGALNLDFQLCGYEDQILRNEICQRELETLHWRALGAAFEELGLTHLSAGASSPLYNQPLPPVQGSVASQPPTSHDQAGEGKNWSRLSP